MKILLQVFAIALCAVSVCALLRRTNPELAVLILLLGCVIVGSITLTPLAEGVEQIAQLVTSSGIGGYFAVLLKALGCAFTAQTAADICRDAGENALASKVELAGRAELLLIAVPLATEIIEKAYALSGV